MKTIGKSDHARGRLLYDALASVRQRGCARRETSQLREVRPRQKQTRSLTVVTGGQFVRPCGNHSMFTSRGCCARINHNK